MIVPLKRISRTFFFLSSHVDANARAKKLAKINFTRYGNWLCTRWEESRAGGQRVETLIRGAWNPTESLGSVEDVEHVARFLIIAPRMERALSLAQSRGVYDGMFVIYEEWYGGIALWLSRKYSFGFVERNNSERAIKATWLSATRIHDFAF